jgi:hypothetical protein
MFKKSCPWCSKRIYLSQLGNKPSTVKPKWFHITRNIQVCPYCAGSVKLSCRGLYWLFLLLPFFIGLFAQLILGKEALNLSGYKYILMLIGIFGVVFAISGAALAKETRQ